MARAFVDPNAVKALNQMKQEFSTELSSTNDSAKQYTAQDIANAVLAGTRIGGHMTKRLVEMGEQELMNRKG